MIGIVVCGLLALTGAAILIFADWREYAVLLLAIGVSLPLATPAVIATWLKERERHRRKELADKLHL